MIRFIDVFAGIGGTRLAFEKACSKLNIKTSCVFSSEINQRTCEAYELNFDEWPSGDIREIIDIPKFDFLLAGFPCQPFSYAGNHEGFGDTRGTLFFEIERILKKYQPKGFLLENVRGFTSHDEGRTFNTILNSLKNLDYGVKHVLLNSSNFGVPQNRVRIYIVGLLRKTPIFSMKDNTGASDTHKYKDYLKYQKKLFQQFPRPQLVNDILENNPHQKYNCSDKFIKGLSNVVGSNFEKLHGVRLIDYRHGKSIHSWDLGLRGECSREEINFMNTLISNRRKKKFGRHQDGKMLTIEQIKTFYNKKNMNTIIESLIKKGYLQNKNGRYNPVHGNMSFEVFKFLDPESISITLTASDSHRIGIVQNNIPRRITPRECARLQGFPDSFKCHPEDKYAYKQIGNSVTVSVIEEVITNFISENISSFQHS